MINFRLKENRNNLYNIKEEREWNRNNINSKERRIKKHRKK